MVKRNSYESLRDFIASLSESKELIRVSDSIRVDLEACEFHRRLLADSGPAVIFDNVEKIDGNRSSFDLLLNLFGSQSRILQAFGFKDSSELRKLGETLAFLKSPTPPNNFKELLAMFPLVKDVLSLKPKVCSGKGESQEIEYSDDDVDLGMFPIQKFWPKEPDPLITWGLVVTKGPAKVKNSIYNLGVYRMQVLGKNKTCMRWLKHRGGAQHFREWKRLGYKEMPVSVVIGCDPAIILAAVTPIPDSLSEYQFAGLLRGRRIELVKCLSNDLVVPATAEIVLEGRVSLEKSALEGPYGDHTGYYNSVEEFPIFTIDKITTRKNAIYLSTFTSRAPDEPSILAESLNEVFVPLLRQQFPEILDFYLPPATCSYRFALCSIKKDYAGQARRVMMGIWSFLRQFLYCKYIIIVDGDINIRDWSDVMWAVSTRTDPVRDTMLIDNTPIDYLDFASPLEGLGSKMGIDATNKMGSENFREWGEVMEMDKHIINRVSSIYDNIFKR